MNGSLEKRANGLLKIAVQRMAKSYPFHAHLLLPERFWCVPEVGTIGVTIRDARLQFWYAPAFVCSCELDELVGVLHHEVNHVLFGHLLAPPEEFPDRRARIVAEEVTVNEWITEPLPGFPITLEQYPHLPAREDTDTRYVRLAQEPAQNGRKAVPWGRKTIPSARKTPRTELKNVQPEQHSSVSPLDNHEIWELARQNPRLGRLVIADAVRHARQRLSDCEWDELPDHLREQIKEVRVGTTSMELKEQIHSRPGLVNWTHALRRLIARTLEPRPALHRAPRRFPHLVGVIPGKSQTVARHRVMAVIDTSASMTTDQLDQIGGELRRLSRGCDVVVVECDSAVQAVYRFNGELTEVGGRGGTDLRPPFARKLLARVRPDVIIYFTDGDGLAPTEPPAMPTIWCLLGAHASPTTWGHRIFVDQV